MVRLPTRNPASPPKEIPVRITIAATGLKLGTMKKAARPATPMAANTEITMISLAFGMIGFLAGILYQKGILKARKFDLCIYGFLSVFLIYGGIMNPASVLMSYGYITKSSLIAYYISGAPVDLVHAASTVIFLWLLSRPLLEKLERIKVKYGLIQESENR